MSDVESVGPIDKGKRRADDVTERTPLLGDSSRSLRSDEDDYSSTHNAHHARRSLLARLLQVFLVSLLICVILLLAFVLTAWSFASRVSEKSPDAILHEALVYQGPSRVDVLNVTEDGAFLINVEGRLGLDAGYVLDVHPSEQDGWLTGLWKGSGRWGIRTLAKVTVEVGRADVLATKDGSLLASIYPSPVEVPLSADPPKDLTWLHSICATVLVRPSSNNTILLDFLRTSWMDGAFSVTALVDNVYVRGGALQSYDWRSRLHRTLSDVLASVQVKIPPIPGLPSPGKHVPLPSVSDLVTLQTFQVSTTSSNLTLAAQATILDPAPENFNFTSPPLPFIISLLGQKSAVPVAYVETAPFSLTHPNITLFISGKVLPLQPESMQSLSTFLTHYLSGNENPILIETPLLPSLSANAMFPAPSPRPHVLRNVTIRDMRLKPFGTTFFASGTIYARIVLPKGIDVDIDVKTVFPDILVFDGEVPDDIEIDPSSIVNIKPPPSPPLPSPLPERAFGHIKPEDWLDALSQPTVPEEGEGTAFIVTAKIVDVPVEVLPGRENEFSSFVRKVVFGTDGALAGILGTAAVQVDIPGLPLRLPNDSNVIELQGLPVRGAVRIGKKSI